MNHPWQAIVGWIVFVALCFAAGQLITPNNAAGKDFRVGEEGRGATVAADAGLPAPSVEKVLITPKSGSLDQDAAGRAAADISQRMRTIPDVATVADPVRSADGNAVMVAVTVKGNDRAAIQIVPALLRQTAAVQEANPELVVAQTGSGAVERDVQNLIGQDLVRAEMITLPITLIILLIVFGSILAAGVPVLLAITSVAAAIGLTALSTYIFPSAGGAVTNIILMMGMAVGVDYSLFYLKREREERARSGGTISHAAAVELAAATSGRTIVVSGFAVIISIAAMFLASDVIFSSIAAGSIIVVLVAMVSSLTVLPAVLGKLGKRVDDSRIPFLRKRAERSGGTGKLWPALLRPAMRHPVATLVLSTLVMVALALPVLGIKLSVAGTDTFPRQAPAVATYDRLTKAFPNEGPRHLVVVEADPSQAGTVRSALDDLASRAQADAEFGGRTSPELRVSEDDRVTTLELAIPYSANSKEGETSLATLRSELVPDTVGQVGGAQTYVAGDVARVVDYAAHQAEKLPWVVGFVLLLTFVMMVVAFRSVVIGVVAIVLNLLSAAGAFGALVGVFQYTWAEGLLGFTSGGYINSRVPLMLFVILFGLSMDYQVFVVSRIREAAARGVPARQAVYEGITASAGVVTSAAVVMVSVFASFIFVSLLEIKQIGFGLAVAVLLDAVIIRIMVLPSLMTLLGRWSWWPSTLSRPVKSTVDPAGDCRVMNASRT
ncbi:MMPL family transporter [Lentzea guizhouensis]|uniref:MMPL family transporter n=1 Tax=Lentzea guizhouensis TaxID=1586287 RepID=UPI001C54DC9E|nr:MMPL family transporter [Lentzea guizhouensis]